MFTDLQRIGARPAPFSHYTAAELWTDPHISQKMLEFHLNGEVDVSSRTTAFIIRSVEWLTAEFGIDDHTRVLDLGCGPGLYTNQLAHTGASVTGVDFSRRSVDHARSVAAGSGLAVDYVLGNYLEAAIDGSFDVITMIMCDFCALGPLQRQSLLGRVADWLAEGGRFVFDVYSYSAFDARQEAVSYEANFMDGFWMPEEYFGFLHVHKYPDVHVVLDKYDIIGQSRSTVSYNWLQHYDVESLTSELLAAGLAVEMVLGDVAGAGFDPEASEFAMVACGLNGRR
jgi:SAM-dependent methyltransferase